MCEICEKRKTLALKSQEALKLVQAIEATQANYMVACNNRNKAAQDSARGEYHRLIDELLDIHAITNELNSEIMIDTINAIFGDDDDLSNHASRGVNTLN